MGPRLDLYWIPVGAGARVVRTCSSIYEMLCAVAGGRRRRPLFHTALVATTPAGRTVIESAPVPDRRGRADRGVVAEGPVGSRLARPFRLFRYEIRCWPGGTIPDLGFAVGSPVLITTDPRVIADVVALVAGVPTPVWGRDELRAGEMWNSNSLVSWVLSLAGVLAAAGAPPAGGRAPGWDAGVVVANRTPAPPSHRSGLHPCWPASTNADQKRSRRRASAL